MRVLIADRNPRLLESISRTFARQLSMQTATTRQHCNALLLQGEFDLAVISEKLADGPGLHVLGQIARNSPDTLRVLAARGSSLQFLEGKLGPFRLLRTIGYPIDPREFLAMLKIARARLEIDAPTVAMAPRPAPAARQARDSAPPPRAPARQPSRPSQATVARPAAPARLPSQSEALQHALMKHQAANRAVGRQVVPRPSKRWRKRELPVRMKMGLVVGATTIVTFLMTTLTLNLVDAGAHVTHASTSRPEIEQPEISTATQISRPVSSAPRSRPAPSVAQRVAPRTVAMKPHVKPRTPQIAASIPPIADPSSFGSEAYKPIYSN